MNIKIQTVSPLSSDEKRQILKRYDVLSEPEITDSEEEQKTVLQDNQGGYSQQFSQPYSQNGYSQQFSQPYSQNGYSQQFSQPYSQNGYSQQFSQSDSQYGYSQQLSTDGLTFINQTVANSKIKIILPFLLIMVILVIGVGGIVVVLNSNSFINSQSTIDDSLATGSNLYESQLMAEETTSENDGSKINESQLIADAKKVDLACKTYIAGLANGSILYTDIGPHEENAVLVHPVEGASPSQRSTIYYNATIGGALDYINSYDELSGKLSYMGVDSDGNIYYKDDPDYASSLVKVGLSTSDTMYYLGYR